MNITNVRMNGLFCLKVVMLLILCSCQASMERNNDSSIIDVWYGSEQHFGLVGNAQRQINILGNIRMEDKNISAYYTLNENNMKNRLLLGCDLHRLAQPGDFNIEIDRKELLVGVNTIHLFAESNQTIIEREKILIRYNNNNPWPLPYGIRWDEVDKIHNVAEIVDGDWKLTESGVRTNFRYYDRILAFGDSAWRNYEVETTVVFHDYTPPAKGPPTYNVSHVAIATRWPGHDKDGYQPYRKWYPLGATAEFRITDEYDSCRWRIFDGENFYAEQPPDQYREIQPMISYRMKHRVMDISEMETQYSVKFWLATDSEPEDWDFQAIEYNEKRESGSALLIAHNTDVTFGDIMVVPVKDR